MRAPVLFLSLLLSLWGLAGCVESPESVAELGDDLDALVASVAFDPEIPGALLYAYSPSLGLDWSGASGTSDLTTGDALSPDEVVRNASNTKTYVAAAVLRLWEDSRVDLNAPVRDFVDDEQAALLSGDGYDLEAITLRHLLSHTAGLIDHGSAPQYLEAVLSAPDRRWTRDDQLAGAVAWGDPLGDPGSAFSYSDTGYILLGQVIERTTGQPLGPAVRELLDFDGLGLGSTWWELMETTPTSAGRRAHQYLGGTDTYDWDPSLDSYGGGGLITSSRDLAHFWYALFTGAVFTQSTTIDTLLTSPAPSPYRLGVFVREFDGYAGFGHSGFWGTRAVYVPELDLVVAGAVTEQSKAGEVFRMTNEAVRLIAATGNGRAPSSDAPPGRPEISPRQYMTRHPFTFKGVVMYDIAALDNELNQMVLSGQALEAFEKFYAEDCVMQENSADPIVGKDANRQREIDFFSSLADFHGAGVISAASNADRSFSEWWMDVTFKDGTRKKLEQVAVRTWKDGLVAEERFYYNAG